MDIETSINDFNCSYDFKLNRFQWVTLRTKSSNQEICWITSIHMDFARFYF